MRLVRPLVLLVALAGLLSSACDTTRTMAPPVAAVAPVANTPAGAVRRLEWAFNHRDVGIVRGLLSDDFFLQSAELDSAGNTTRDAGLTRDSLLAVLRSLFEGGPGVPGAVSVRLSFDPNLVPFNDTRPGKNPRWHKTIRTAVDLVVVGSASQRTFETTGHGLCFLSRGDSTAIPADEIALGTRPDSTRWWIERWEDETIGIQGGALRNSVPLTSRASPFRFHGDRAKR